MKNIFFGFISITVLCLFFATTSCNSNNTPDKKDQNNADIQTTKTGLKKPVSTYQDTFSVTQPAAVFYYPDSIQLLHIKAITDSMVYDGAMHEYLSQMRNASLVLKKSWPGLIIVKARNCRYLLFKKTDGKKEWIDLDNQNDTYGLFVFDGRKKPLLIDMENIETQVSFYLKQ